MAFPVSGVFGPLLAGPPHLLVRREAVKGPRRGGAHIDRARTWRRNGCDMGIVGDRGRHLVGPEPNAQSAGRPGVIASGNRHRSSRAGLRRAQVGHSGAKVHHFKIGEEQALEPMSRILDVVVVPRLSANW